MGLMREYIAFVIFFNFVSAYRSFIGFMYFITFLAGFSLVYPYDYNGYCIKF